MKHCKRAGLLLLFNLFMGAGIGYCQSTTSSLDNTGPSTVISPSPVAASLFKDVNVPVNYFTGTPEINIPLHTIRGGKLKMPINLKYTASGIRVEQDAGLTGLGWDLQTGGVISRSVIGRPDEEANRGYRWVANYLHLPAPGHDDSMGVWQSNLSNNSCALGKLSTGLWDLCPDNYFMNFNGNSARLFFDMSANPCFSPYKAWKLTGNVTNGYTVVTEDGTTYAFLLAEKSSDAYASITSDNDSYESETDVYTSWYLTQIISADKADTINLQYISITYTPIAYNPIETTGYLINHETIPGTTIPDYAILTASTVNHLVNGYLLTGITSKDEQVSFYNSLNRSDVSSTTGSIPYKLDSIADFSISTDGSLRKLSSFVFNYDYYNASSSTINQRLRLLSVSNIGKNGEVGDVYQFHYDGNNVLPARSSMAQDNWGFYNGAIGNTTLIPSYTTDQNYTYNGANRDTDTSQAALGLLTSIQYPTGGTTSFEYEANRYNTHASGAVDSIAKSYNVSNTASANDHVYFKSSSFTITSNQYINITATLAHHMTGENDDAIVYICPGTSTNQGDAIYYTYTSVSSTSFSLNAGTYTVCASVESLANASATIFVGYVDNVAASYIGTPVGGARIKRLVQSDGNIQTVKRFMYLQDSVTSSGKVMNMPIYSDIQYKAAICNVCSYPAVAGYNAYLTFHSTPTMELGRTQGSHICYTRVTVLDGDQGENGKEDYYYQFTDDQGGSGYPYAPRTTMDDFRGQLLSHLTVNASGKVMEKDENTYNLVSSAGYPDFKQIYGVKVGTRYSNATSDSNGCPAINVGISGWVFMNTYYPVYQLWPTLATTKKTLFSMNTNDSVVTVEQMGYNAINLQPSTKKTWNSKGDSLIENYTYPDGFAGTAVYDTMSARNMLVPPIESDFYYDTVLRAKDVTNYQLWPGNGGAMALPLNKQLQYLQNPIETRRQFLSYDNNGNLLAQSKTGDAVHSYIWDYWDHSPIAEAVNAAPGDIAYTSFEADGTGNWTVSGTARAAGGITGSSSYDLSAGTIGKTGLNSGTVYVLSYWTRSGSPISITGTQSGYPVKGRSETINNYTWNYYEYRISGQSSVTLSGSGIIDELRLYPLGAQMTTFTYDRLVGMTSQCDIGNRVTYYEYDGLQRLKRVRDQDQNILKSLDYQYMVSGGCGNNCYPISMQTFNGTQTIGYPVGVFDVHGKLLGNATGASQYVNVWNNDTADARIGTLSTGTDSLHFSLLLNTGMTLPAAVTGLRYYQVDLKWNQIDGIRNMNASYVDFGDSTSMRLGTGVSDTAVLAPGTTYVMVYDWEFGAPTPYYIHTYRDTVAVKTITFYHCDSAITNHFDNKYNPANSLIRLSNFRGNLPQRMWIFGGSSYEQASMNTVANISNWNSIQSITYFNINNGDGTHPFTNMSFAQDFMQYNTGLNWISTTLGLYRTGYRDTTFKISRLKSDWNTYFTQLGSLSINDDHWNREDLSGLKQLKYLSLFATTQDHQDDVNSPLVPIPQSVLDNIFNQIAAGSGQTITNGSIVIYSGGSTPSDSSATARQFLQSKGWTISIN